MAGLIQLGELASDAQSLSAPQGGCQSTMVVNPQAIATLLCFESVGWHVDCCCEVWNDGEMILNDGRFSEGAQWTGMAALGYEEPRGEYRLP